MNGYREIRIVVPKKRFGKLPERIEYLNIPYGRMEKAWRLLIRSMRSAIDNEKNDEKYSKIRSQFHKKNREHSQLHSKIYKLKDNAQQLRESINRFDLKVEGCSVITNEIKESEKKLKELEDEMREIKQQVPKYMWDNLYWW